MRTAAILALGFLAVFVVSLLTARGSDSPPRSTTDSCGPYRPHRPGSPPRYVAYATETDCRRARRVALAYNARHVCRRRTSCKAMVEGLHCRYVGDAGRRLGWVGCGRGKEIDKPRVFFSVDRRGSAAPEPPDASALPT